MRSEGSAEGIRSLLESGYPTRSLTLFGSAEGDVLCRGSGPHIWGMQQRVPEKFFFFFRRRRRQEEAKPKITFEVTYENTSKQHLPWL
jgi:hypothetical protein